MRAEISRAFGRSRAAITIELETDSKAEVGDLLCGLLDLFGVVLNELARGRCPRCSCEDFCDCALPCRLCALMAHAQRMHRG